MTVHGGRDKERQTLLSRAGAPRRARHEASVRRLANVGDVPPLRAARSNTKTGYYRELRLIPMIAGNGTGRGGVLSDDGRSVGRFDDEEFAERI